MEYQAKFSMDTRTGCMRVSYCLLIAAVGDLIDSLIIIKCQIVTPITRLKLRKLLYYEYQSNRIIPGHYPEHSDQTNLEKFISQFDPTGRTRSHEELVCTKVFT